jgi:hypothetical protein
MPSPSRSAATLPAIAPGPTGAGRRDRYLAGMGTCAERECAGGDDRQLSDPHASSQIVVPVMPAMMINAHPI